MSDVTFLLGHFNENIFSILTGTSCNKNQKCIKVQECPSTNKMLEALKTIDDAKEKEKLISSIRSLICGRSTDRTVCCDNDNGEYLIFWSLVN